MTQIIGFNEKAMYSQFAVLILQDELRRRQVRNPRYSTRAFAKFLGIDPSLLGKFLTSKRMPTNQVIEQIEKKLGLSLELYKGRTGKTVDDISPKSVFVPDKETATFFHMGWEPYAFLARMSSGTFRGDHRDLAREFGMNEGEARRIFEKIVESGLVTKDESGVFRADKMLVSNKGLSHFQDFHKMLQSVYLNKSLEAIKTHKERCHFSSVTFRMSPAHLELAKSLSALFRRHTTHILEGMDEPEHQGIYNLQVSLVPLSKGESGGS